MTMENEKIPRAEYPRPDFVREEWMCLNGAWEFAFDDQKRGLAEHWERKESLFGQSITVPFAFQSALSGIGDTAPHDYFWYKRTFTLPNAWEGRLVLLHFGAVDYEATVFVNGCMAGAHRGGSIGFTIDITRWLRQGANDLTVHVYDPTEDEAIPRGKQSWLNESHSIWYTRTSGIWQSVWLEPVAPCHIKGVKITPDVDAGTALLEADLRGEVKGLWLQAVIRFQGREMVRDRLCIHEKRLVRGFDLLGGHIFRTCFHDPGFCWTPETPNLFDLELTLEKDGQILDRAAAYFGMRKIHAQNGILYLNNRPYYQKLVLDQGYWPQGLLTAPEDEAFVRDIALSKQMGFNGCRKHQKAEDPRFLYWADKMGFLVWSETASAPSFSRESVRRLTDELIEEIERDYNHPSIVAWVTLNESWGVPNIREDARQQSHSLGLYYTALSLDNTRLVVSNDGWQATLTDICAVHNYNHGKSGEEEKCAHFRQSLASVESLLAEQPSGKAIYADGFRHRNEPIMLTEFGGIAFNVSGGDGWGYTAAKNEDDYLGEYARVIDAVYQSDILAGFCYTQLTDVEQEINGLLTYDRRPKVDPEKIKTINDRWHKPTKSREGHSC